MLIDTTFSRSAFELDLMVYTDLISSGAIDLEALKEDVFRNAQSKVFTTKRSLGLSELVSADYAIKYESEIQLADDEELIDFGGTPFKEVDSDYELPSLERWNIPNIDILQEELDYLMSLVENSEDTISDNKFSSANESDSDLSAGSNEDDVVFSEDDKSAEFEDEFFLSDVFDDVEVFSSSLLESYESGYSDEDSDEYVSIESPEEGEGYSDEEDSDVDDFNSFDEDYDDAYADSEYDYDDLQSDGEDENIDIESANNEDEYFLSDVFDDIEIIEGYSDEDNFSLDYDYSDEDDFSSDESESYSDEDDFSYDEDDSYSDGDDFSSGEDDDFYDEGDISSAEDSDDFSSDEDSDDFYSEDDSDDFSSVEDDGYYDDSDDISSDDSDISYSELESSTKEGVVLEDSVQYSQDTNNVNDCVDNTVVSTDFMDSDEEPINFVGSSRKINVPPAPVPVSNKPKEPEGFGSRDEEPKDLREFLRKHPHCEMSIVYKYFTKKEVQNALLMGRVIKKGTKLHI